MSDIIRKYEPEECALKRQEYLRDYLSPLVSNALRDFPELNSAIIMVAQYWCDEAYDAVHADIVYSLNQEPDIDYFVNEVKRVTSQANENGTHDYNSDDVDPYEAMEEFFLFVEGPEAVEKIGNRIEKFRRWETVKEYRYGGWDSNGEAIPLFAAYCPEGGHQEGWPLEFSAPAAILRRGHDNTTEIEVITKMVRPWLDGVKPECEVEHEEYQIDQNPMKIDASARSDQTKKAGFWQRLFGRG